MRAGEIWMLCDSGGVSKFPSPCPLPRGEGKYMGPLRRQVDLRFIIFTAVLLIPLLLGVRAVGVAVVDGVKFFGAFDLVFEGVFAGGDVFTEGLGAAELALLFYTEDGSGPGNCRGWLRRRG